MENTLSNKDDFDLLKAGDFVVYPSHGVGRFLGYETTEALGFSCRFVVIDFPSEKMTLRIPCERAKNAGLRRLYSDEMAHEAFQILSIPIGKSKKVIWGRRAQEYESRINSGDLASLATVLRELYERQFSCDQSYSERQIYQLAIQRFVREYALVFKIPEEKAVEAVEKQLKAA